MACDNLEEMKAWLDEARAAYRKLIMGKSPRVIVDQNGERVEYTAASATRLSSYISGLEAQIAQCEGRRYAGPMRVYL